MPGNDCATVDEKWRGIGIRIEDDVLVTKQGYQVLSHAIPKTIAEIDGNFQITVLQCQCQAIACQATTYN
jgi:hypothetical protein